MNLRKVTSDIPESTTRMNTLLNIALGFVLLGTSACRPSDGQQSTNDEMVRPAIYHVVQEAAVLSNRSFPARISASGLRELTFPVGGVVLTVPVNESQVVTEGQLLAQLDARDYESALNATRARVENAVNELERARRLSEEDAIAKSVLEQREAAAEVAQSEFEAAQKALADTRILAPFDGIISRVFVSESQAVVAGTPAVRIFTKDQLEATIAVPASLIVNADGSRQGQSQPLVRLDVDYDRPIEAVFKMAELEADANSQSYAVTFGFKPPEDLLVLPGMNAEVELTIRQRNTQSSGLKIPLRAILAEAEERYVWVVDTEVTPNRVNRREISVASAVGDFLPVLSGLESGEIVVAAGVSSLVDGMAVRPWSRDSN